MIGTAALVTEETETREPKLDKQGRAYGTGRRKDSSTRMDQAGFR